MTDDSPAPAAPSPVPPPPVPPPPVPPPPAPEPDLADLVALLDLEQVEVNIFRGDSPDETLQRVFGGQVAGQALVAAGRTVPPDRPVHSLHAYFLRPGDPAVPIVYMTERVRDGRHFTTRRVVAVQHGKPIFTLNASFHLPEPGFAHQTPMPEVPPADTLPTFHQRMAPYRDELGAFWARPRPIDVRYVEEPPRAAQDSGRVRSRNRVWLRASARLPDDPLLHVCALTYASDMTLLDSVLTAQGLAWGSPGVQGASLDHAMWFHAPFRADEWLLYDQESPASSDSRGLARGQIFTADGRLVVSVVQEGLIRYRPQG